jgi:pSer/pThr/pTyr-binding forkhead associated (FHA) protein/tetratricopeptide (TPR) repeat protein
MSRLKVMLRGALISEIELNQEKEYIGGRKDGCDIRLQAEKGISREHFKIKFSEGRWLLTAVSRFGDVFSLGQKVETADLQHGQSFQVPPYEFTFVDMPDAGLPAEDNRNSADFGENEKTVMGAAPQVPYIKMVNSAGEISEMLRLEVGEVWVAGRDPSCQIIIPDQRVSRRQFEIYKVNGAYTVLDLASVNGTFLNGTPVSSTDPQTLKSGDAISVLDNTMYFELHDPNFKYKIEKIEVPPLQIDQIDQMNQMDEVEEFYEEALSENEIRPGDGGEIPQIDQYDTGQQLVTSENPFTGMPGQDQQGPNQYYDFQPPPQPAPPATGIKKIIQNKPLLITLVLLLLSGAYYLSEMLNPPEPVVVTKTATDPSDPFSKLTPAQQKEVEEYYALAQQMFNQQKYDLAIEKTKKIKELLPTGYKESEKIAEESNLANLTIVQQARDEEMQREKEELIARNKETIDKCSKLLVATVTSTEMSSCLAPVLANPGDDTLSISVTEIMTKAEAIEKERELKKAEAIAKQQQVADLNNLFAEAEKTQSEGFAFKAIKKYQAVIKTTSPDPKNLRSKSKDRIEFISQKIKEKSEGSINQAETYFKAGKLKDSIVTLREALIYDPNNKSIHEKIELYVYELKRQVKVIYQESIIDENYGIIDNTETKQGAKEKWKKITEIDLLDGEYYRKAVTKLRRYGVM